MAGLTETQKGKIWNLTLSSPLTVQQIADKLGLIGRNGYQMVYRFLTNTKAKLSFFFEKSGSLLWVRANPREESSFFSGKSLDLICNKQNSEKTEQPEKTGPGQTHEPVYLKRACPEKLKALLKLNRITSFGHFEGSEWIKHNGVEEEVRAEYLAYCNRAKAERLEMAYSPTGSPVFSESYTIPFKTRFTDPGRQAANLDGFRADWNAASRKHCVACELTLTARPYGWASLVHCNRETNAAFSKFMDFLRYHIPDHAEYIAVREFQKNGRLHFHITIFGINWLMHKSAIQYAWRGYGGGEILDIHTIRRRGASWVWSRSRPEDAAGVPPFDYLRKYLEKSMTPENGFLFWAFGFRNWTGSQSLKPKKEEPAEKTEQPKKHFLKGTISKVTGYRHSNRSDTKAFFSGAFKKVKRALSPKPKDKQPPKIEKPDLTFTTASNLSYQC